MPDLQLCPTDATLRSLLLGSYPGRDADALGDHLLACPACGAKAERLVANDPLLADLRAANDTSELGTDGTFVEELRRRVKGLAAKPAANADLAFLAPPDQPGDLGTLDRYRVVELLGQGGMGMVFKAIDPTLKRTVALKIILPKYAGNVKLRERFIEEAQATARVRSAHVAEVYDCGVWRDVSYQTMELLAGQTLDKRPRPMPTEAWRRIAHGIAKGLSDAHRVGLVHRDLKPSNIHLGTDARTGKPTVKIIDFGLARPVNRDIEVTKSGELLGTPAYMSPEQARGKKVDHRTDLYSLGVILHQLATGHLPYLNASEGVFAILTELATPDPLPSVTNLATNLPPILASLIDRLLAKDPTNRPASADEVMKILKDSLTTEKLPASTEVVASAPYVSISDTGSVAPTAATPVPFGDLPTSPLTAPSPVPAPLKRRRAWLLPAIGLGVLAVGLLIANAAGLFVKVKTPNGTIELTDLDPDAEVLVDGNVVTVSWDKGKEKAEIRVKPGTRKIEVRKKGFTTVGEEVSVLDNERTEFVARLSEEGKEAPAPAKPPEPDADPPRAGDVPAVELVENGTCEHSNLKGWTIIKGKWNPTRGLDPYFRPGVCGEAILQQDVDVSRYAQEIDGGQFQFAVSAMLMCYSKGQRDKAQFKVVCVNGERKDVGTLYDSGLVHEPGVWRKHGGVRTVPAGTRVVRITLRSVRDNTPGNQENSGYFDTVSLKPVVPAARSGLAPPLPGTGLRCVGYVVHRDAATVPAVAGHANVLLDRSWPKGDAVADAARKAGLPLVLAFHGKEREGVDKQLFAFVRKHRDVVAGVSWDIPYWVDYSPEDVAALGRAVKQEFPELKYWVSFVEKPRGQHETRPVPDVVDVVQVSIYYDTTAEAVRDKTDDTLPGWLSKAKGRPVFLRWACRERSGPGLAGKVRPGAMRACFEAAKKHALAGVVFDHLGEDTAAGVKGIDTNQSVLTEIRDAVQEFGVRKPVDRKALKLKGKVRRDGEELSIEPDLSPGNAHVGFGDSAWTDYDVAVDVKGNAFLFFRVTDANNFWDYETLPDKPGCTCRQRVKANGTFTPAGERLNVLDTKADGWNRMKVSVRGDRAVCYFNDREVCRHTDARNPAGHVALGAFRGEARFRNLVVTASDGTKLFEGFPDLTAAAPPPRTETRVLGGQWRQAADRLFLARDAAMYFPQVSFGDRGWTDYDFTVQARRVLPAAHQFGLCFRSNGQENQNTFSLGAFGNTLYQAEENKAGKWNQMQTRKAALKLDVWYTATVKVRGNTFECLLAEGDGPAETIFRGTTSHPRGQVGLVVFKTGGYLFRNVMVTAPNGDALWDGLPDVEKVAIVPEHLAASERPPATPGFTPLFNGKDTAGWEARGNASASWKVENGVLVGSWPNAKDVGGGSSFVTTRADYRHFHLRLRAMKSEVWASRIFVLTGGRPDGGGGRYRVWLGSPKNVAGEEVGRLDFDGGASTPLLATPQIGPNTWFTLEVIVLGNRIQVLVDGKTTADFTDPNIPAAGDRIKLHLAGGGAVRFQSIEVQELALPKAAAVGFTPLFNGKDTTGWEKFGFPKASWFVEDGVLVGKCPSNAANDGSQFVTLKKDYRHFHLKVRAMKPATDTRRYTSRVALLPGRLDDGVNAYFRISLGSPDDAGGKEVGRLSRGRNDPLPLLAKPTVAANGWYTLEVIVQGNRVQVLVDGVKTADVTDDAMPKEGHPINLTCAQDGEVRIRGVEIQELPAPKPAPAPPAVSPTPPKAAGVPVDPFAEGTVWRGVRVIEDGTTPGESVLYQLTIDTRTGPEFTGSVEVETFSQFPAKVAGTITADAVEWKEVPKFHPLDATAATGALRDGVLVLTTKGRYAPGRGTTGRAKLFRELRPNEPADQFHPLFNGRTLDNWETHFRQTDGWAVKGGRLVGAKSTLSHLYTRQEYGDVHVWCRAKVGDGGRGGVFAKGSYGPGRNEFPVGYKGLLTADDPKHPAGSLDVSGTVTPARGDRIKAKEWFDLELIAKGDAVRVLVNGKETAAATDPAAAGKRGRIALQVEQAITEIEFAMIAVKELKP